MECAYVLVYNEIRVDVVGRVFCRMRRRDTHARTYTHTHAYTNTTPARYATTKWEYTRATKLEHKQSNLPGR